MSSNGGLPRMRADQLALLAGRSTAGSGPAPQTNVLINPVIIITPGRGEFTYSPSPGFGNLIASTAASSGTDRYGNAYLAGQVTYGPGGLGVIAMQLDDGAIAWWTAPTAAGPWTQPGVNFPALGLFEVASGPDQTWFTNVQSSFSIGGLAGGECWILPSGDMTGATDWINITLAFLVFATVHLLPGIFYINQTIVMAGNQLSLQGAGPGRSFATTIMCKATSPITGMICCGPLATNTRYTDIQVSNLTLIGNANAGHLLITRCEAPTFKHLTLQTPGTGSDCFHASWDGIAGAKPVDTLLCEDVWAQTNLATGGARGFFVDTTVSDSDLIRCVADGTDNSGGGGALGLSGAVIAGPEIRLVDFHPFGFTSYGIHWTGGRGEIGGGEAESCAIRQIFLDGAVSCDVHDINTYYNYTNYPGFQPVSDIGVSGGSDNYIHDVTCSSGGSVAYVEVSSSPNTRVQGFNFKPAGNGNIPPTGFLSDLTPNNSNYGKLLDGYITGPGTGANAVALGGGQHWLVRGVTVLTADKIAGQTGANFNTYSQNDVTAFGAGGITDPGANSIIAADNQI